MTIDAALRVELLQLEREERQVSDLRRKLHERIDRGFSNPTTVAHEREVSDHRRELHRRIDGLRARLV